VSAKIIAKSGLGRSGKTVKEIKSDDSNDRKTDEYAIDRLWRVVRRRADPNSESRQHYKAMFGKLTESLAPSDFMELMLVEQLESSRWTRTNTDRSCRNAFRSGKTVPSIGASVTSSMSQPISLPTRSSGTSKP
jgi:hypothetical protein